jgi:hypothetical protein
MEEDATAVALRSGGAAAEMLAADEAGHDRPVGASGLFS